MKGRLKGRRVLVTGAGAGMGRAIARRMVDEGADGLAAVDIRADRLDTLREELESRGAKVAAYCVDLADVDAARDTVTRSVADLGGLEVVVSNAGMALPERLLDTTYSEMHQLFAVNLFAGWAIGQEAARHMVEAGHGGVILYTAALSENGGLQRTPVYSMTKAALINFVRSASPTLAPYGIRINAVSPGFTDTNLGDEEMMASLRRALPSVIPMGRMATPEDIAAVFAFLASDDAAYVTGANYLVDGGVTAESVSVPWFEALSGRLGDL